MRVAVRNSACRQRPIAASDRLLLSSNSFCGILVQILGEAAPDATTMNEDQIKGKLEQLKGEMKRRWGQLTDDDIAQSKGDMEKLLGRIREKSGDQQQAIEEWFRSHQLDLGGLLRSPDLGIKRD